MRWLEEQEMHYVIGKRYNSRIHIAAAATQSRRAIRGPNHRLEHWNATSTQHVIATRTVMHMEDLYKLLQRNLMVNQMLLRQKQWDYWKQFNGFKTLIFQLFMLKQTAFKWYRLLEQMLGIILSLARLLMCRNLINMSQNCKVSYVRRQANRVAHEFFIGWVCLVCQSNKCSLGIRIVLHSL
jgi:hypothetical protein